MSWAADVGFEEFVGQFQGVGFASAHHFRQRHSTEAMAQLGMVLTKKLLGR